MEKWAKMEENRTLYMAANKFCFWSPTVVILRNCSFETSLWPYVNDYRGRWYEMKRDPDLTKTVSQHTTHTVKPWRTYGCMLVVRSTVLQATKGREIKHERTNSIWHLLQRILQKGTPVWMCCDLCVWQELCHVLKECRRLRSSTATYFLFYDDVSDSSSDVEEERETQTEGFHSKFCHFVKSV